MAASSRPAHARLRILLAGACLVAGLVVLLLGVLLADVARGLFTADGFANRAAVSLRDPRVAAFVADRITDGVLHESPDLTSFRPLLRATAQSVVGSEAFGALARQAARRAHQAVFSERSRKVLLSVPDVGLLLRNALQNASPELAGKIPRRANALVASLQTNRTAEVVVDVWRLGRRVTWFGILGMVAGPLLLAVVLVAAMDRRRALFRIGIGLLMVAAVLVLARPLGRTIVGHLPRGPLERDAAAGFWDAATSSWRAWTMLIGGVGLVLAAAAHSLLEQIEVGELVRRLLRGLQEPPWGTPGRLVRAGLFIGLGLFAVVTPSDAMDVFTMVVGGAIAFEGLREVFAFLVRRLPEFIAAEPAAVRGPRRWPLRTAVVGGMAALLALALIIVLHRSTEPVVALSADVCNGAAELCDRRVDQVVFPAAHNAMSAADIPNWMFPEQEKGVRTQLDDGIRALLIDAHYGRPVGDRIKTDMDAEQRLGREVRLRRRRGRHGRGHAHPRPARGSGGRAAGRLLRARLLRAGRHAARSAAARGARVPGREPERGAAPGHRGLRGDAGPRRRIRGERACRVRVSGSDYAPGRPCGRWWPKGNASWCSSKPAAPVCRGFVPLSKPCRRRRTPSTIRREFSCAPNRGGTSGSLFMINHWIETAPTPKPSNAAIVNAYDFLLARCRQCQAGTRSRCQHRRGGFLPHRRSVPRLPDTERPGRQPGGGGHSLIGGTIHRPAASPAFQAPPRRSACR